MGSHTLLESAVSNPDLVVRYTRKRRNIHSSTNTAFEGHKERQKHALSAIEGGAARREAACGNRASIIRPEDPNIK